MTHEFTWEGITIRLTRTPNRFGIGHDHLEIRSAERIPITTTEYKSHFIPAVELALFASPEAFVRQWLDEAATSKDWQQHLNDSKQLSLF